MAASVERARERRRSWVATGVVLAVAVATVLVPPATAAVATGHRTPRADGPFAVARRTVTFVDTSRPTAPNGSYPGAPTRTLPTLILYPALGDPSGTAVIENGSPARGHRFPLVVFSHGFGANGPAYEPLLRLWVRAGYVIAAPTFPLSSAGAPGGPKLVDYKNQPGDVSFVITQMLHLDRTDRGGLRHLLDRDAIGAAGHSLGAITTLGVTYNTCCQDPRIDAAVPLSGIRAPFDNGVFFTGLTARPAPLLLVHGDHDGTVPYVGSSSVFTAAPTPKFFQTLVGAPHTPFRAPWLDPIVRSVTDFLDRYLKHERRAQAQLRADATAAGVTTLQEQVRPDTP